MSAGVQMAAARRGAGKRSTVRSEQEGKSDGGMGSALHLGFRADRARRLLVMMTMGWAAWQVPIRGLVEGRMGGGLRGGRGMGGGYGCEARVEGREVA